MIVTQSTAPPLSAEEAYAFVLSLPLATLFAERHGPFPPIVSTEQDGYGARPAKNASSTPRGAGRCARH